jgi:hypothetical protein
MTNNPKNQTKENAPMATLETGTYEIIRSRLQEQGAQLSDRLQQLGEARRAVFGGIDKKIIANNRIHTSNYCTARDITALGQYCILGYNVHIGLRSGIKLEDVFSIYQFDGEHFHETSSNLLQDDKFLTDFNNLYRYYKEATFARFVRQEAYLYMVFQVSDKKTDIKAFKWLVVEDKLQYIDARSEKEVRWPKQHEFQWVEAGRDAQRNGRHPHISILDKVFVEAVGGDITIKVEDNTEDGRGIYSEEVEYKDQTLDDGVYSYAALDHLIALRIQPYQEVPRYFLFNEKDQSVKRVDGLKDSGILLPEGHGLIFPGAYYLKTGTFKQFSLQGGRNRFLKRINAPNGEDFLYIFYNEEESIYSLLHYNLISQEVDTPILCNGFASFPSGALACFRAEEEAVRHHLIQVWQTPFGANVGSSATDTDHYLYKIGNKDIVKAMADSQELLALMAKEDSYAGLYEDLEQQATSILDTYHFLGAEACFEIEAPLSSIRDTALTAIEAFEKKQAAEKKAQQALKELQLKTNALIRKASDDPTDGITGFVQQMAALRHQRGEAIAARKIRYVDEQRIDQLEAKIVEKLAEAGEACVHFLLQENALIDYHKEIEQLSASLETADRMTVLKELEEQTNQLGDALQLLMETVHNLKMEDVVQATQIIERLSALFGQLNQLKADLKHKQQGVKSEESKAAFHAEVQLLEQATANLLDWADDPVKCDEALSKAMVQVEELEGKFAEFDVFVETIAEKRAEVYGAFDARKRQLLEAANNKATALERAAQRLLDSIQKRCRQMKDEADINAFFASDLMVDKVRDLILQLKALQDTSKASTINSRLQTVQEEALRQLHDRQELFVEGENIIQLGKHAFEVNVQELELTIVQKEGVLCYHITGTDFYEPIESELAEADKALWEQVLPSENDQLYRAEFLAYQLWKEGIGADLKPELLANKAPCPHPELLQLVTKAATKRYEEGYTRGVHDVDACQILQHLIVMDSELELLRYPPDVRALALLHWHHLMPSTQKETLNTQLKAAGKLLSVFPEHSAFEHLVSEIERILQLESAK